MPLEMSIEDINSRFKDSLIMYNNKPSYVKRVGNNGDCILLDLITQKQETVPFKLDKFNSPVRRVGMVNIEGSVVYAERIPIRRFKVGLSYENFHVSTLDGVTYPARAAQTRDKVRTLQCVELGEALMDKYPSLSACLKHLKQFPGAMAFDKQFAVSDAGLVFYKKAHVGSIGFKAKSVNDIEWRKGYEHLILLLENNYATETLSTFGSCRNQG